MITLTTRAEQWIQAHLAMPHFSHGIVLVRDLLARLGEAEAENQQLKRHALVDDVAFGSANHLYVEALERAEAAEAKSKTLEAERARIQQDFADDLADRQGDLYEQVKELRDHAAAIAETKKELEQEVARLTGYVQHWSNCGVHRCGAEYLGERCNIWQDDHYRLDRHPFQMGICTCGLLPSAETTA